MSAYPSLRMRRLRQAGWTRRMVRETNLTPDNLIWAIVVSETADPREAVAAMPGVDRLSIPEAVKAAKRARDLGIPALALFPHTDPAGKDATGSAGTDPDGLMCRAIRAIKDAVPDVGLMCDVALDPYTDHGHDGVMKDGRILNDETIDRLVEQAVAFADAGCDIVAPSDMMDGRIGAIRDALEAASRKDTLIMSYAAKYASAFYGPYREAVGSATALQGDKKTYQMDPANISEALREVALDLDEGADMVMVKPGMPYLDILHAVKEAFDAPTFAFQVSGEYAMIKAAAMQGWIDEERAMMESLTAFRRAGASGIITYFAEAAAKILNR